MAKKRKSRLSTSIRVIGIVFKLSWIILTQILFILAHVLLYTVMFCQWFVKFVAQTFNKGTSNLSQSVIKGVEQVEALTASLYLMLRRGVQ